MVAWFQVIQGVFYRLRGVIKGCCRPGKGCREEVSSLQHHDYRASIVRNVSYRSGRSTIDDG